MRLAELSELETLASDVAKKSAVASHIHGVSLEADQTEFGGDFLRVVFSVQNIGDIADEELLDLMHSVQDALSDVDERFPSVRFAEAA